MNKYVPKLFFIWIVVLSVLYSALSIQRHNRFESGGFDLGIYDQAVWQYSQFLYPYNTIKERLILGDHLTLTLPLLSPLFYFWDDIRILLIFQAVWISFSAVAIYKISRLRNFSEITSLCVSVVYSLFYGIQSLIFFDFHPVAIGVGLLAWSAYFLETNKTKWLIISSILLILTQENMGIALSCLGFVYFLSKNHRKTALFLLASGIPISIITGIVTGLLSPVGFQYTPKPQISELLVGFFNSQEKRDVLLYSFSWFSFLPVLSVGAVLAVILDLSQYFITGPEFARMWSPFTHHRAILGVFLALGVLDSLLFLKKKKINIERVSAVLLIIALFLQYYFHFPLNKISKKEFWKMESWMEDNEKLIKQISPTVSLATQQNLIPHVSHRREIYLVFARQNRNEWYLDFAGKPEFLLADTRPNQWLTQVLEQPENFLSAIKNMEEMGKIKLEKQVGDAKLFRIVY